MNNSFQVKYRELTACFVFVNYSRNVFFSSIGMCCLCLFVFFRKLWVWEKNQLNICKPMGSEEPMKNRETVRKTLNPCDTWWDHGKLEVCKWFTSKLIPHHQWPSITYTNKSHSRESFFFSKENLIFRSSHIFKFIFSQFFFCFFQRILKSITSRYEWLISEIIIANEAGSGRSIDNGSLWNFLTSFFKTSVIIYRACLKKDD